GVTPWRTGDWSRTLSFSMGRRLHRPGAIGICPAPEAVWVNHSTRRRRYRDAPITEWYRGMSVHTPAFGGADRWKPRKKRVLIVEDNHLDSALFGAFARVAGPRGAEGWQCG